MPLKLNFYDNKSFETPDDDAAIARNTIKFFINGLQPTWRDFNPFVSHNWRHFATKRFLDNILKTQDPKLFKEVRDEFKRLIEKIPAQIEGPLSDDEQRRVEFIIHNLIALYPFLNPENDEILKLPRFVEGLWQLVDHRTDRIKMSPTNGDVELKKHIHKNDKVYSYGFVPINNDEALPILSLMGSTFPSGQGKKVQSMANRTPNGDVGAYVYVRGKPQVEQWIEGLNKKVVLTGVSQGAILATMFSMTMPDKIEAGYAFSSPGFKTLPTKSHPHFGEWFKRTSENRPKLNIVLQEGDPVTQMGRFPEGVHLWKTKLPESPYWRLPFIWCYIQHIVSNVTNLECKLQKCSTEEENNKLSRSIIGWFIFNIFLPIGWALQSLRDWTLSRVMKDTLDEAFEPQPEESSQDIGLTI